MSIQTDCRILIMIDEAQQNCIWLVRPIEDQRLVRRCPRCERTRDFYPSGRFRVNAQKKLIDVWHIYRCQVCDYTWNVDVISRTSVEDISSELYSAFTVNDPEEARRHTFNYKLLAHNKSKLAEPPKFEVVGTDINAMSGVVRSTVSLQFEFLLPVKIAQVIQEKLGVSRHALEALVKGKELTGAPIDELFKMPKGDLRLSFDVAAVLAARDKARTPQPTEQEARQARVESNRGSIEREGHRTRWSQRKRPKNTKSY